VLGLGQVYDDGAALAVQTVLAPEPLVALLPLGQEKVAVPVMVQILLEPEPLRVPVGHEYDSAPVMVQILLEPEPLRVPVEHEYVVVPGIDGPVHFLLPPDPVALYGDGGVGGPT